MEVSIIGFGAEHLDGKSYDRVKETFDAVLEQGINVVDVFMPGSDIRQKIGKAIRGNRDKFIILGHIGSTDIGQQYDISRDLETCKQYFENLLKDLGTDYIDIGMLFFIDTEECFDAVFNSNILKYAQELKRDGVIKAIGASSHDPVIAKKMVETGIIEVLMFSLNPAFDMVPANIDVLDCILEGFDKNVMLKIDEQRMELYKTCEKLGVPITVMKTLGGGKLLSKQHTPFAKPLTVPQCIHYALTRPAAVSTLIGFQSRKHVEDAMDYLKLNPEELDFTESISSMNEDFKGNCVYCNHCLPCPAEIDIATVTKYLDIAILDEKNVSKSIKQHYGELTANASDCTKCGSCEKKCPFSVPVMDNMDKANKLFSMK